MFHSTDYDKLQQIMQESPEKSELLSRLLESHRMDISTISHEIRNPLTLVYSTLQLIESQHPEVLSFDHWSELHQDIEYMTQLLEELSSYNNGERLNTRLTDMNTYLKVLSLSFASSIIDTDIEFSSEIRPDLPSMLIDPVKLKQALLNLLRNARDAVLNSDASSRPSIRLTACTEKMVLKITISDTGCGILADEISSIFEPFITHKPDGTGLGLTITRRVIQAHGGSVKVSSVPGDGTEFTILLPVQENTQ